MKTDLFHFATLLDAGDHIVSCQSVLVPHILCSQNISQMEYRNILFQSRRCWKCRTIHQTKYKKFCILKRRQTSNRGLDLEFLDRLLKNIIWFFIVDNCFATPYLQQPIKYGSRYCRSFSNKLIDGQGRVLGGVAVGKADLIRNLSVCEKTPVRRCRLSTLGFWAKFGDFGDSSWETFAKTHWK